MRPLTDAQFWGGVLVLFAGIGLLVFAFLVHWRKIDNDILKEDRARLKRQAEEYAEKKAQSLFREYVAGIRVNIKPALINESDIDWGDNS